MRRRKLLVVVAATGRAVAGIGRSVCPLAPSGADNACEPSTDAFGYQPAISLGLDPPNSSHFIDSVRLPGVWRPSDPG
jgi:hypothetical protein